MKTEDEGGGNKVSHPTAPPVPKSNYEPTQPPVYQDSTPAPTPQVEEKKPFWESTGFKNFINSIITSRPAHQNPKAPTPPKVVAPPPPTHATTHAARGNISTLMDTLKTNTLNSLPPRARTVMTPQQITDYVNKTVKKEMETLKKPRYVFLSDGTPVYLNQGDERAAYMQSIQKEPPVKRAWLALKYNVANTVGKTLSGALMWGAQKVESILTDTDQPNVPGDIAQLGINSVILGSEILRGGWRDPLYNNEKHLVDNLEQRKAQALAVGDTETANKAQQAIDHFNDNLRKAQIADQRIGEAQQALFRAWAKFNGDVQTSLANSSSNPVGHGAGGQKNLDYYNKVHQQQQEATALAAQQRDLAAQAYAAGNFQQALDAIKSAQSYDRQSQFGDPYGAYTWQREPEREKKFLTDTALAELQKGAPLTTQEIQDIKEHNVNSWTELTGQVMFDPLNLIPPAIMEKVVGVPLKLAGKGTKAVVEHTPILGDVVKWLGRESVISGGNTIARNIHSVTERVFEGVVTNEDKIKSVDALANLVTESKRATSMDDIKAILQAAQESTPALRNIQEKDVKLLVDASNYIPEARWAAIFQDDLGKAEDALTAAALKKGKNVAEIVTDESKSMLAEDRFAVRFNQAFVDPHRIYKGARLVDDSLGGWITKTLREMSGQEINDALKLNGFDDVVTAWGKTISPHAKQGIKLASNLMEGVLHATSWVRDTWSGLVLGTPRWIVNNTLDNMMRDTVYGGNMFDDLWTLFTNTQRHFVDDLGEVPLAIKQSFSKMDLDIAEDVTTRIVSGDFNPKFGIFSYWADAARQLRETDAYVAKRQILDKLLDWMPEGKLKDTFAWLGDGLYLKTPATLKSFGQGISNFNQVVEFTFRLRSYHRNYFTLLTELEPQYLTRSLEGLSPATREIAEQVWKLSDGNSSKMVSLVDSIVGTSKSTSPASWSFLVPDNVDELTRGMDLTNKQLFISDVRNELETMIQEADKAGQRLTREDISTFFDNYKTHMQNEIQNHLNMNWNEREANMVIGKDGVPTAVPELKDLKGSAPLPKPESPRNQTVEAATERLRRKRPFQKTENVAADFETVMSESVPVEHVPGDGVRYTVKNGQPTIVIGDEALKGKPGQLYKQIHEATLDAFVNKNTDGILRSGFHSVDEYKQTVIKFISEENGPTNLLAKDERKFMAVVDEMTRNPDLQQLLKRTGTREFDFDSAVDVYRNFSAYDDAYGFTTDPQKILEEIQGKGIPTPGYYSAAARDEARMTGQVINLVDANTSPALRDKINQFVEQWAGYRQELHQHWYWRDINPLSGDARRAAWDNIYFNGGADAFNKEATIKATLVDLFKRDPVAAEKYLDDALADFPSYFLKEQGYDVVWDAGHQKILDLHVTRNGKKVPLIADADKALIEQRFYSKDIQAAIAKSPVLKISTDGTLDIHSQLTRTLRDTFKMPDRYASGWARTIENHAEQWAKVTGQDVASYYKRLGFVRLEEGKGLGVLENTRLVKGGAIQRGKGQFMFYGLGSSDFETMVRETGELFFDDFVDMSKYSDQASADYEAIRSYIEDITKSRIRGNKLNQKQSEAFTELFTRYIAEGSAPDIKLKKPFERFKSYLVDNFKSVYGTPLDQELTDDVYRTMNRMFTESKLKVIPDNTRAIKSIAKEAGIQTQTDDELLKTINQSLQPPYKGDNTLNRSLLDNIVGAGGQRTKAQVEDLRNIVKSTGSVKEPVILQLDGDTIKILDGNHRLKIAKELGIEDIPVKVIDKDLNPINVEDAYKVLTDKAPGTYKTLGDIPRDVAENTFKELNPEFTSTINRETQEAWDAWKTQRSLNGFPEDALSTPDTFKAYLQERIANEWSETGWQYNRLLKETEQFEESLLNFHVGEDFQTVLKPRILEGAISPGTQTWIRNNEEMISNYEAALKTLDEWKNHMGNILEGNHPVMSLTDANKAELAQWVGDAAKNKTSLLDVVLNGGKDLRGVEHEGAVNMVNRVMLDYQHRNVFDQFMKNIFPFWMFPSRSLPFWVETMATHPQLIAAYEKVQSMSRTQRYQAGAVTTSGKPLPSLDGYVKIPGTDLWFNPLAPFSFRYALDIAKTLDNIVYQQRDASQEDLDPKAFMAQELLDMSQVYGFSMAPWFTFLLKDKLNLPDSVVPTYPLAPQISLFPRWVVDDMINKANILTHGKYADTLTKVENFIYPEVSWKDYLIEREILQDALLKTKSGNLTPAQQDAMRVDVDNALKTHSGTLWEQTKKDLETQQAYQNWGSFFTGVYAKPFTDGQAELLKLRNDINLLKSSLNNEFQASVFDLPTNAHDAYQNYLDKLDTPEGWYYGLYTDINWVQNDLGQTVTDPVERAKWLALQVIKDENLSNYYQSLSNLQKELTKRLQALPVGATYEQKIPIYKWYDAQKNYLTEQLNIQPKDTYYTNKPAELIADGIKNEWYKTLSGMAPQWDYAGGETYLHWQQRMEQYYADLPELAKTLMPTFIRRKDIEGQMQALREDQQLPPDFFDTLMQPENSSEPALNEWKKQNDDVLDAVNKVYKENYWDAYWNSGVLDGTRYERDQAEQNFAATHPIPSAEQIYAWVQQEYGDRFTPEEVYKYVNGTSVLSIEQKNLLNKENPEQYQEQQRIWDMLSWLGPGSRNTDAFNQAFINNGGDPQSIQTWYDTNGTGYNTQPDKLKNFMDTLTKTMATLNLSAPTPEDLAIYVQATNENKDFHDTVVKNLGEQFFDYTDENGDTQMGLLSYYYSMDTNQRKTWRRQNPEVYQSIKDYYNFKDTFGADHPVWNEYYGFDTTPSVNTTGLQQQTPASFSGGVFTRPTFKKPEQNTNYIPSPHSQNTRYEPQPYFGIISRLPGMSISNLPPALAQTIGSSMLWEIGQLYQYNRKLSTSGVSFLTSIASRHREWSSYIEDILSKNGS